MGQLAPRDWCPEIGGMVHKAIPWGVGFLGGGARNFCFPLVGVEPERYHWLAFHWRQAGVNASFYFPNPSVLPSVL